MKLIDKDKLLELFESVYCHNCNNFGGDKCRWCDTTYVKQIIEDFPTVEEEGETNNDKQAKERVL